MPWDPMYGLYRNGQADAPAVQSKSRAIPGCGQCVHFEICSRPSVKAARFDTKYCLYSDNRFQPKPKE